MPLFLGTPPCIEYDSVKDTLLSVRGVKATHSLHIWALTMSQHHMSVHALIGKYIFRYLRKEVYLFNSVAFSM